MLLIINRKLCPPSSSSVRPAAVLSAQQQFCPPSSSSVRPAAVLSVRPAAVLSAQALGYCARGEYPPSHRPSDIAPGGNIRPPTDLRILPQGGIFAPNLRILPQGGISAPPQALGISAATDLRILLQGGISAPSQGGISAPPRAQAPRFQPP